MKKFVWKVEDKKLVNKTNGFAIELKEDNKYSLATQMVLKNTKATLLNSLSNALTGSMGNGNELVNIVIEIKNEMEEIGVVLNSEPMVKNSLDYHELVRTGRDLIAKMRKLKF